MISFVYEKNLLQLEMNALETVYKINYAQMEIVVQNPLINAGDMREASSIPELGRSPGGGHGNPLQYSCLENPMDRGTWQATVHKVAESRT